MNRRVLRGRTLRMDVGSGSGMGEVGITDHNMLTLRREHPSLIIHKHTAYEENRTGADWK